MIRCTAPGIGSQIMWTLYRLVFFYVVFLNISGVCGGGHLSVRLVRYVNPGGNGENGNPCDGRYFFTGSPCDHRFIICVDKETGGNSMDKCHFGRVETPSIPDQDTVSFPTNIRGLKNPILFNVTSWPDSGKFILKVDVWDDDSRSKDEHVEYLYKYFVIKPNGSRYNHTVKQFMLHRRTRLTLDLAVFCDQFYFGASCDIVCQPRNDSLGHYTCNSKGRKQCLKGWRGQDCRQMDYCADSPCQNNGTCLQRKDSYNCSCPHGFVGVNCDIELCKDNYCRHDGDCYIVGDTHVCVCIPGWTGNRCQDRLLSCDDVTCSNNGTCTVSENQYNCRCTDGWQGDGCLFDVDECKHSPCQGQSECINTKGSYRCQCSPGWTGINCTEQSDNPCLHGVCVNPRCLPSGRTYHPQCLESWSGVTCLANTQIGCHNNTTCGNNGNGTSCVCDKESGSGLREGNEMTSCLSNCSSNLQCEVTSDGEWSCTCGQQLCYLPFPEFCCSVENDSNVSLALTPLNSFNESYFDQDHFMSPCSDFNMTFFTASLKRTNDSQTQYLKQEISAKVTFDNETTCTMWRQWVVTYCLHPLIGDDQSYEYDDDDTDPALTDPSLLMDSNYESINWYPLTGLLAVPVFVGIVCFVVLRRRLARQDSGEDEDDEEALGNVPATFHNILYAEMNN